MKSLRNALFVSTAVLTLGVPLSLPTPPPTPDSADIAALFDPLQIARGMCGGQSERRASPIVQGAMAVTPPDDSKVRSPLFPGLGTLSFKISTKSPKAQAYFDQGLRLFYAFNPGEAVASFRAARDADPSCAMCYWGEALTLGPNLNGPMFEQNNPGALAAVAKAKKFAAKATPLEQALIGAVAVRYSGDKTVARDDLDLAYVDAMSKIYAAYKNEPEVGGLYAEAALNIRSEPFRRWWDKTGRHPSGYVARAVEAIEGVLASHPDHPGAIHLYIHALDDAADIAKVEPYANKLRHLMPNAGHMVHMPSHTFFSLGRYKDALEANVEAISVDDGYLKGPAAATVVYRYGLYQHNVHFALGAASMAGDEASALRLAKLMDEFQKQDLGPARYDISAAASTHAVVRFQSPDAMLALPEPDAKRPYMVAMWHYARGTAYAYQGDVARAEAEAVAIEKLRESVNKDASDTWLAGIFISKDMVVNLLGVAAEVVRGRVSVSQGKWMDAANHFSLAVKYQDEVDYRDPPFWDFPVRQAAGIAYFRAGKTQQAAEILRQALFEAPSSGFALYALKEVSAAMGDTVAATEYGKLFQKAWIGAKPPALDRL